MPELASLVIRNYEEAKGFHRCCGFECLRLIARESSVKARAELLFFRNQLANSTVTGQTIPEIVRKIQSELFQFERVSQLVDPSVNIKGLEFAEADKTLILLRALPQQCRQWIVLNNTDESFVSYVESALRYEAQQRTWLDLNGKPIASLGGFDPKGKGKERKGGKGRNDNQDKEGKGKHLGKGKGTGSGSETRSCFQCGERGHLSANCPNRDKRHGSPEKQSKGDKGKGDGKGKSKEKGKKGEKGDKGGKGKMKGKKTTEFSQPESEAGSEVWSEPDFEDGGRLSTCMEPSLPVEPFFMCQNLDDHDTFGWSIPELLEPWFLHKH